MYYGSIKLCSSLCAIPNVVSPMHLMHDTLSSLSLIVIYELTLNTDLFEARFLNVRPAENGDRNICLGPRDINLISPSEERTVSDIPPIDSNVTTVQPIHRLNREWCAHNAPRTRSTTSVPCAHATVVGGALS